MTTGGTTLAGYTNHTAEMKREAERKEKDERAKAAKKTVKERLKVQKNVYPGGGPSQGGGDNCMADKIKHLNDLNPETLVGEVFATLLIHLFESAFAIQYQIQKNEYQKALQIDAQRDQNPSEYDDIRIAYKMGADGKFPAVYPVDQMGNINYYATPNTDGKATRFAIRANGFVPVEDVWESYAIQFDKFQRDMSGSNSFSAEQKVRMNIAIEQAKDKVKNDMARDNSVVNAARPAPAAAASRAHKP